MTVDRTRSARGLNVILAFSNSNTKPIDGPRLSLEQFIPGNGNFHGSAEYQQFVDER